MTASGRLLTYKLRPDSVLYVSDQVVPSQLAPQPLPPRGPQLFQRLDIALKNRFSFGKRRHGTFDARLAQ